MTYKELNPRRIKNALSNYLNLTLDKESYIKKLYKIGKIKKITFGCYSCPRECFSRGITPKDISEVLD